MGKKSFALGRGLSDILKDHDANKNFSANAPQGESSNGQQVVEIQLDLIDPNPFQPRKFFSDDELSELAETIKTHGLLTPINVRSVNGHYVRGQSEADWLGVIRGLRAIGFDGLLVLALRDTAAACPPLLRPALLACAKKTGEYLAWQIGMDREIAKYPQRVLFGAGRMCRNYLLNYGAAYPPLFTCDNNPATWGTEVDGLPVKSPEALRELPEDCAIFICNIYYRDIEAQLREMGLRNPVAYFNDECPPRVVLEKMEKRG